MHFDNDGNIEKKVTSFDMTVTQSGITMDAHCDSTSIITIGNVTVTAPADADSYILTEM